MVCGGNGVTTSSTVPSPSGTLTSRVTRAWLWYTVTATIQLGEGRGTGAFAFAACTPRHPGKLLLALAVRAGWPAPRQGSHHPEEGGHTSSSDKSGRNGATLEVFGRHTSLVFERLDDFRARLIRRYFPSSHAAGSASLGIRQSPRGERLTVPTFGPSGTHERLNCWLKNRRVERPQRPLDQVSRVMPGERGVLAQEEDLLGRVAAADGVEQDEVVQLVRAERRPRSIARSRPRRPPAAARARSSSPTIESRVSRTGPASNSLHRHVLDQELDQRLGDRAVRVVHAHVIAVIGAPAQCQLGEVAGADDEPARHQQEGPQPGLHVLEDQVVARSRGTCASAARNASTSRSRQSMPNGAWFSSWKVCRARGAMSIVSRRDAEVLHQVERVGPGPLRSCRSRAWSGRGPCRGRWPSRSHVLTATSSGERRVEPARDADVERRAGGSCSIRLASPAHWMPKISAQRRCSSGPSRGHERRARDRPLQAGHRRGASANGTRRNGPQVLRAVVEAGRRCGGRPGASATSTSRVIAVRAADGSGPPSPTRGDSRQQPAVLGDQAVAAEDQVGRRLRRPRAGVGVGRDAAARLADHQVGPILALADRLVAGREVQQHVAPAIACAELGGIGIQRSSQISTPDDHAPFGRVEQQVDPERDRAAGRVRSPAARGPSAELNQRLS